LPVLMGLSSLFTVRRVLELGAGRHSTSAFLDRYLFPDLLVLHSLENDQSWLDEVTSEHAHDPRVQFTSVAGAMQSALSNLSLGEYDLIFVDDSKTIEERTQTIDAFTHQCPVGPLMVIHDFEQVPYQEAADRTMLRHVFDTYLPATGVLWRVGGGDVDGRLLALEEAIRQYRNRADLDCTHRWKAALEASLHHEM
jgi:hypothetical protein